MNIGRIFTEPQSGGVNILPLFTEIEKNNCFSIYTGSDIYNIFRRKPLKIDSETLAKREFTPAILLLFGLRIIHSVGGEKCSLARDEPIRLLKTPRSPLLIPVIPSKRVLLQIMFCSCVVVITGSDDKWQIGFLSSRRVI